MQAGAAGTKPSTSRAHDHPNTKSSKSGDLQCRIACKNATKPASMHMTHKCSKINPAKENERKFHPPIPPRFKESKRKGLNLILLLLAKVYYKKACGFFKYVIIYFAPPSSYIIMLPFLILATRQGSR